MTDSIGRILSPLRVEHIDGHKWRVSDSFVYHVGSADGDEWVEVPAGFVTDFASVPRPLWAVFPPSGRYSPAALVHDKLYVAPVVRSMTMARAIKREECDHIFLEAMEVLGVSWLVRRTMYRGVRLGGWVAWRRYRQADLERA